MHTIYHLPIVQIIEPYDQRISFDMFIIILRWYLIQLKFFKLPYKKPIFYRIQDYSDNIKHNQF